ncbi:MAG: S46 family peptidase, partial [Paludibacter sp.]|nr:S46 family peptidase [Paludibacter sp.]
KQAVWKRFMQTNEAINIAYAGKYARSSNYWKNSIGMNNAIKKLHIIEKKKIEEKKFAEWTEQNDERKLKYGQVLTHLEEVYSGVFPYAKAASFLSESLTGGIEMPRIANQLEKLGKKSILIDSLLQEASTIYKDYYAQVDEATFAVMLEEYKKSADADALPEFYNTIDKKFNGDLRKYATYIYSKSAFTTLEKYTKAITLRKINYKTDPALVFWTEVNKTMKSIQSEEYSDKLRKIADAERLYEKGLKEMAAENGTILYPDANSTMRLTYGKIAGYYPADGVKYSYYTTTKGIIEKEKPGDYEFDVPAKLTTAISQKDFGTYMDTKTGEMHVAFLSNNDITGGNSGSPIFNAKGELIGLAFDGNWEAMSGDIVFEPDLQRTINVDIRYMLFVMDKVGGAKRLIDELLIK